MNHAVLFGSNLCSLVDVSSAAKNPQKNDEGKTPPMDIN